MTAEQFEALVRAELARRDQARRGRLLDPGAYAAADEACVAAIMSAAGFTRTEEQERQGERTVRKARRGARANEAAAFRESA